MTGLDAIPLDRQTPAQHRQRYEALRRSAQDRANRSFPLTYPPIRQEQIRRRQSIPGGWYWSTQVRAGHTIRIAAPEGAASVAVMLWNAHDRSERFNAPDTMKLQWTVRLGTGQLLLSDMGRVLAGITADSCGRHDLLLGGAVIAGRGRNTRDNLLLAAGKHGLDRRDVPPCLTLFADVRTGLDGRFEWHGCGAAGSTADLRAEMDLLLAVSNGPHPLDPAPRPGPVDVVVWDAGPVPSGDPCRNGGPEARRAYENTEAIIDV